MTTNATQRAIDSIIRLHSPQPHEVAFALAILDIALINIDSSIGSYSASKAREVLAVYLNGSQPELPQLPGFHAPA